MVVVEDVLGVGRSRRAVRSPAARALSMIPAKSSGFAILKDQPCEKSQKTIGVWLAKCVNYTFNI